MKITDLGGHSGCKVKLIEDTNRVFVRKIAANAAYNDRLKRQMEKQKAYNNELLKAPKIYSYGIENELFYFDMEYIQGITLAESIKSIEAGKIGKIVDSIANSIYSMDEGIADESIFKKKIESLTKSEEIMNSIVAKEGLKMLESYCWDGFKKSACHGDMTLENIIVKDNELYLIDFLDSFYDCWIIDAGTLLQDVQLMWSYRMQKSISNNTMVRLLIFHDILLDKLKRKLPESMADIYYALLLKLLRIYPYTKDQYTLKFLDEKTNMVINILKRGEYR